MKQVVWRCLPLFLFALTLGAAEESEGKAQQLAREVWQASGGESWGTISELRFTFIVEDQGKQLIAAEHQWDLKANTDHVKWKDKDVTVNLATPPAEGDAKAAYGRWVNDSYWLLAPLKVLDPGVKVTTEGTKEIAGTVCEMLRLSFAQVGLTPSDQYVLYVDPATKLVRAWDYIPEPETLKHGTWENYEKFGGLNLSTTRNFDGKVIRFTNIKVTRSE